MTEEQNWDEVLITNNPESKEIEVSFKKIDGDGFLSSRGDEPGTPGGATEDENGCANAIGLVSDDVWLLQNNAPHWVWITLRSIPTEEYTVTLTFTDGTLIHPEYVTQTLDWLITPGSWEANDEGVTGIKVPLSLGDVSRLTDVGTDSAFYNAAITAVNGIAVDCWQSSPVTLDFGPTPAENPPEEESSGGAPVPGNNPECLPHACDAFTGWLTNGNTWKGALHTYSDPPNTISDLQSADTFSIGFNNSQGNDITTWKNFISEDGEVSDLRFLGSYTGFNETAGIRIFDRAPGEGPCDTDGCGKITYVTGPTLWEQMNGEEKANSSYPKDSINGVNGFDERDSQWNGENAPDGEGFEMHVRTAAAQLIWPYDRNGNLLDGCEFRVTAANNNDLQTIFNGNPSFAAWYQGSGFNCDFNNNTISFPFFGGTQEDNILANFDFSQPFWLGIEQDYRVVIDYDTISDRYQITKTNRSRVFDENGYVGAFCNNDDQTGYIYNEVFRIYGDRHLFQVISQGLFTDPNKQDLGQIASWINGGTLSKGSLSGNFQIPFDAMKNLKRSLQGYTPPTYCNRIP